MSHCFSLSATEQNINNVFNPKSFLHVKSTEKMMKIFPYPSHRDVAKLNNTPFIKKAIYKQLTNTTLS